LKLKCVFQRTSIKDYVDHKSKYKKEIDCGEKMVGEGRVARPRRKTIRSYHILVKPF
jgi:hypothetical protein